MDAPPPRTSIGRPSVHHGGPGDVQWTSERGESAWARVVLVLVLVLVDDWPITSRFFLPEELPLLILASWRLGVSKGWRTNICARSSRTKLTRKRRDHRPTSLSHQPGMMPISKISSGHAIITKIKPGERVGVNGVDVSRKYIAVTIRR